MLVFEPRCSTCYFHPSNESRRRGRYQMGWRPTNSAEWNDGLVSTRLGSPQEKISDSSYRNWSLTLKKVLPMVGQALRFQGIIDQTPTPGFLTRQTPGQFLPTPGFTLPASASSCLMRFLLRISALLLTRLYSRESSAHSLSVSFCTLTPEAKQPDWLSSTF